MTVGTRLQPLQGYPFALDVHSVYEPADDGSTLATTASNTGDKPCL